MRFIDSLHGGMFRRFVSAGTVAALAFAFTPGAFGQESEEIGGDVYTLDTCPVSGEALDAMGDPLIKQIDGREVRFCCGSCVRKLESDQEAYFKKIDAKLIEQQLPYYPLVRCVVSGERLVDDGEVGEDGVINFIYKNRLVRFCREMCVEKFSKDPKQYLHKLDAVVVELQRKRYPLETCPISGQALDSMGEPFEMIVCNRLVKLCCKGCKSMFEKEPAKYLKMIDDAWKPILAQHALTPKEAHNAKPEHDQDRDAGGEADVPDRPNA